MNIYIITHTHRHGIDTKLIRCEGDFVEAFNETDDKVDFIDRHVGFDYEPHYDEEICIDAVHIDDITIVEL